MQECIVRLAERSTATSAASKSVKIVSKGIDEFGLLESKIQKRLLVLKKSCLIWLEPKETLQVCLLCRDSYRISIREVQENVLISQVNLATEVRKQLWLSLTSGNWENIKIQDFKNFILDEDDQIIALDVKRTYSQNLEFNKKVDKV